MESIRIGVGDGRLISNRFDLHGRLTLTWHLAGFWLGASALCVSLLGIGKLKSTLHILISSGYALSSIIEAYTKHHEKHKANHADPVQFSCHFIASPDMVPYKVHIKTLKPGRPYTNLYAESTLTVRIQPLFRKHEWSNIKETKSPVSQEKPRLVALALYGDLAVTPHRSHGHNVAIPSPYSRRVPLFTRPSLIE